jgi:hypothetical protein
VLPMRHSTSFTFFCDFKFALLQGPDDFTADSLHWSSVCSGPTRHSHSFRNRIGQMGGQDADGDGGS